MTEADSDLKHGSFDWETLREMRRPLDDVPAPPDDMPPLDWRVEVIEQVRLGHMSPQEAEALAHRRGARPFCSPKKRFKSFDETLRFWTPEMALSWIKYKSAEAVHRHHPPSYRDTSVWVKSGMIYSIILRESYPKFRVPKNAAPTNDGYRPVMLTAPVYPADYYGFDGSYNSFPDLAAVYPALRTHLIEGTITAFGVPPMLHSSKINIERHHWLTGSFDITPRDGGVLDTGSGKFTGIHFHAEGLMFAYPAEEDVEWRTTEVCRWREPMPRLEGYKQAIIKCLQAAYPEGLPIIRPLKARDRHLIAVLGEKNIERWFGDIDQHDAQKVHQANEAFRTAMTRVLKEALHPAL